MKNGLLSLLAVALTVVGCQNYDDQFDDLKTQITDLAGSVATLTQVQSELDILEGLVQALQNSVNSIPTTDSVADLSGLTTALANAQADIDSLEALLNSNQALTQTQLGQISSTLADVQQDVQTLLESELVFTPSSGVLRITNESELIAAEAVVPSSADAGTLILRGDLEVNFGSANINTADHINRANLVLAKFNAIIAYNNGGAIDVDGGVLLTNSSSNGNIGIPNIVSTSGTVTLEGTSGDDINIDALRSIGGDLVANHGGDWDYTSLDSVAGDVVVGGNAVSVNLSDVTVGGTISTATSPAANLVLNTATGTIILGTADVNVITAPRASAISGTSSSLTNLTITSDAETIDFNSATSATGVINITASTTTIIHFDALQTAANITITDSEESHFGALETTVNGTLNIGAEDATDLSSLTELDGAAIIGGASVNLTALAAASNTLSLPDATSVTFPDFVATGAVTANEVTSGLTLKSISPTNLSAVKASSLSLTSLDVDFDLPNTTRASNLTSATAITITGSGTTFAGVAADQRGVTTNNVTITTVAGAALTDVNVGGKLDGASITGPTIDTVTTGGFITDFTLDGTAVTTLDLNHSFIGLDTAVTITVNANTSLASVDLADVSKVKTIELTGNTSLTTIVAPSTTLPEAGADITVTITDADLEATYTEGVTGTVVTQTVPAQAAEAATLAIPASIEALLDWYDLAAANTSTASAIEIDFTTVNYVDRVRDTTDGSISNTASTTVYTSFEEAVDQDGYSTLLAGDPLRQGNDTVDRAAELAIIIRD